MVMMPKILNAVGCIICSQEEVLADAVSLEEKHVSSENHTGEHKTHIPVISPDQKISWESVIYRFFVLVFASITIATASNRVKETKI